MSASVVMMIVGVVLFLAGLAKLGSRQSGGFSLSNFGINFGGSVTQTNRVGDVTPGAAAAAKMDWVGLIVAVLGLLTAIVGWLKG